MNGNSASSSLRVATSNPSSDPSSSSRTSSNRSSSSKTPITTTTSTRYKQQEQQQPSSPEQEIDQLHQMQQQEMDPYSAWDMKGISDSLVAATTMLPSKKFDKREFSRTMKEQQQQHQRHSSSRRGGYDSKSHRRSSMDSIDSSTPAAPTAEVVLPDNISVSMSTITGNDTASAALEVHKLHALLDEVLDVQDASFPKDVAPSKPSRPSDASYCRNSVGPRASTSAATAAVANTSSFQVDVPLQIEVSQGHYEVVRSAAETWQAVQSNAAEVVSCLYCQKAMAVVADCQYVMCPDCRTISPMPQDDVAASSKQQGVGLGLGL